MKTTNKIAVMLIGLSVLLFSCDNFKDVIPSSSVTTVNYQVGSFSEILVENAVDVEVNYVTGDEGIEIEANANLHEYIEIFIEDDQLVIKIRDGAKIKGNFTIRARINTTSRINNFSATGASKLSINGTSVSDNIEVSLSGASFFTGDVESNSLNVYADGASNATISGTTQRIYVNATGASTIGRYDLTVVDTDIRLKAGSRASMIINGKISLSASGASVLIYKGSGVIDHLDLSGGSQIVESN